MWEILIVLVIAGVAWVRLLSVEKENRRLRHDLGSIREEIQALRQAFLKRISALEENIVEPSSNVDPHPVAEPVFDGEPEHPATQIPQVAVEGPAPVAQSVIDALTPPSPPVPPFHSPAPPEPKNYRSESTGSSGLAFAARQFLARRSSVLRQSCSCSTRSRVA